MDSLPVASLSVHHVISSVGADAGFAALIAVAILVLLYFAQARETATLRTRAEQAEFRAQALEVRVADLADQVASLPAEISVRAVPRPAVAYGAPQPQGAGVPAAAGVPGTGIPPAPPAPPAAPAGMAAPALAAATRLIPDPVRPLPEYAPVTAAGGNSNGSSRPVVAASAATVERPVQAPAAAGPRPVGAPPRTAAGGGRPGGGDSGRPPAQGQPRRGAGPAGPGRPGAVRPQAQPLRPPPRRSRGRLALGALVAALALGVVVAGVIILTGGSSNKSPSGASASSANSANVSATSHHSATTPAAVVRPSTVTVSVLNGTDMQGLAGEVSKRLVTAGYRKGAVTNASDQTHTSSVVAYLSPSDRREAFAVATALKLKQSAVQPIDSATQKIACSSSPLGCASPVIVTVGTDLAGH